MDGYYDDDDTDIELPPAEAYDYPLAPPLQSPPPGIFNDNRGGGSMKPLRQIAKKNRVDGDNTYEYEVADDTNRSSQLSSRMKGFWDPDEDVDQTYHFMVSGGAGGPMDWDYQIEQQEKRDAAQRIIKKAEKEYKNWDDEDWEDPCVVEKFEFDTCIKIHRHHFECAMSRDVYSRCRNEFTIRAGSMYAPKNGDNVHVVRWGEDLKEHRKQTRDDRKKYAKDGPISGYDAIVDESNRRRNGASGGYIQILDNEEKEAFADSDEWFGTNHKNDDWMIKRQEREQRIKSYWGQESSDGNDGVHGRKNYMGPDGKVNFNRQSQMEQQRQQQHQQQQNRSHGGGGGYETPPRPQIFGYNSNPNLKLIPDYKALLPKQHPHVEALEEQQKTQNNKSPPADTNFPIPISATDAERRGLKISRNEEYRRRTGIGRVDKPRELVVDDHNWDLVADPNAPLPPGMYRGPKQ